VQKDFKEKVMLMRLKNKQFKSIIKYLDENPNWLEDSKDINGRSINYVEVAELVWSCVKKKS